MMELSPILVEQLIFGGEAQRRRTQDSPVLPDVWAYFATPSVDTTERGLLGPPPPAPAARPETASKKPAKATKKTAKKTTKKSAQRSKASAETAAEAADDEVGPIDLLLTPQRDAGPARLAAQLRRRLGRAREETGARQPARIAYTQTYVVARIYFDEVVRVLLPLTPWWRKYVWRKVFDEPSPTDAGPRTLADLLARLALEDFVEQLGEWTRAQSPGLYPVGRFRPRRWAEGEERFDDDLIWMVRIAGAIQWARDLTEAEVEEQRIHRDPKGRIDSLPLTPDPRGGGFQIDWRPIVAAAGELLDSDLTGLEWPPEEESGEGPRTPEPPALWMVNRNRHASRAVKESRRAIKADAATQLFGISCRDMTWAVIDSGIDASHPAFFERSGEARPTEDGAKPPEKHWSERTRVVKTYDFTRIRPLLDQEVVRELLNAPDVLAQAFGDPKLDDQLAGIRALIHREDQVDTVRKRAGAGRFDPSRGRLRAALKELTQRLESGLEIDWQLLEPLLRVPHEDLIYEIPLSSHGTHVAGILAADWGEVQGVCPDIKLYDLRVLDPHGPNDEFTVLAALQFVQWVNKRTEGLAIQGANLSLSIRHEVTNYACGRTPVCGECERLIASGVVVVAAAGNAGWDDDLARVAVGAGYRVVSITDPGNAEEVITVGATHRDRPHSYGVSFFSSRGPTGDGRSKPDLVAPGEKISSSVPEGSGLKREDGTSMAAPHVSGAAALLMARHRELIGRPRRVKEILCCTATDLGRTRDFQGAGMLDVLRALQSV